MSRVIAVLAAALAGCVSNSSGSSDGPLAPADGGMTPDLSSATCGGMICNSPPGNSCQGSNTLLVYSTTGTCDHETCTYAASAQSCPTGCANGNCVQQPVLLVPAQNSPIAIAVDATSVYWSNFGASGSVMKASLTGQNVTTLASTSFCQTVAVDASSVYWTNSDDSGSTDGPELGSVMKASLSGQNITTLASGQNSPASIGIDAAGVYWVNADFLRVAGDEELGMAGTVMKASLSGQNIASIASGQNGPFRIALDATSVYWIDLGGTVMKTSRSGQGAIPIATGQSDPSSLAVGASNVYWSNSHGGTVMMASLTGQNLTTIASGQSYPGGLAVDASGVYWVNGDGTIMKASPTGQGVTTIVSGQDSPAAIALDATSIYWVNEGDSSGVNNGSVMKIAK